MKRLLAAFVLTFCLASFSHAQPKLGAVGDSLLDEHFDQSGFGTNLGYSMNALELMVNNGKIDVGPTGNWGGTRGTGYEYNWALAGSTTSSLLSGGQHTNLANQIPSAGITKAVMIVGANDLFPFAPGTGSDYEAIYEGGATPEEINLIATRAVNNVIEAAQTLKNTGVDLLVATAPDYGIAPLTKTLYPDPVKRERVDYIMESWNNFAVDRLINEVEVPVVDMYSMTKDIWGGHGVENDTFLLGGVAIDLDGTGGVDFADVLGGSYDPNSVTSDTVDAFVHDGIHPNNTIGGIFANLFMTAYNEEYGDNFVLFSEEEILQNAGPNLGAMYSSDTFSNSLGGKTYSDYVISAVPEPTGLMGVVAVMLIGFCRHRNRQTKKVI